MIVFDEDLKRWFRLFRELFHHNPPLEQIPEGVDNEQLIDAIKQSIEAGENLLPVIFGYGGKRGIRY